MFALEAVKAKHGDCLLLHWGTKASPKVALIDGGPDTTYAKYLKPRLASLAKARRKDKLNLDLTMVSHIDDDHINGILALADDIENGDAPADIGMLWFNSLEGLLKQKIADGSKAKVTASINAIASEVGDPWDRMVLASVPQGQELDGFAKRHGIIDSMNHPFKPLILMGSKKKPVEIKGLSLTVLGPFADELEELRKKWKELRKKSVTAAYKDASPYNLSSIVVLAEFGKKKALLTGDARGDRILAGLDRGKLLKEGKCHVDLLKLPHHGSQNNTTQKFFEQVTADIYVVSGDHVKFPNPHEKTMKWLADARGNDPYEVYCTYDLPYMRKIFKSKLRVPKKSDASIVAEMKS